VLAQVIDAPQVTADGTVNLSVAEGVVEDIQVNLQQGEETNEQGEPIAHPRIYHYAGTGVEAWKSV